MDTDKKETTDLAKAEPGKLQVAPASPMAMAMELCKVNSDMSIEKMERILKMEKDFQADQARKDFASDFAIAQANVGAVVKTKWNPQTSSHYADLASVIDTAKPSYTERGFSVVFYEGKAEKEADVRVCADVLHRAGHKETYYYDVPMGGKGIKGVVNMIDIHAKATSVTYGQRYLTCMIWNIPTQDADGNPPPAAKGPPEPTEEEQAALQDLFEAVAIHTPGILELNKDRFAKCVYAQWGYPHAETNISSAAKAIIEKLTENDGWEAVCQKL